MYRGRGETGTEVEEWGREVEKNGLSTPHLGLKLETGQGALSSKVLQIFNQLFCFSCILFFLTNQYL